jgi:hypothetical protein
MTEISTGTGYYRCPDCEKRGVTLRLRVRGEDHYGCRYCDWFAYTLSDSRLDIEQLRRLQEVNPNETVS